MWEIGNDRITAFSVPEGKQLFSFYYSLLRAGAVMALGLLPFSPASGEGSDDTLFLSLESTPRFERVSFPWRRVVDYVVINGDGQITIVFDGKIAIDGLNRIKTESRLIGTATQHSYIEKVEIRFAVLPGVRVRHFRNGSEIILDILRPAGRPNDGEAGRPETAADKLPAPDTVAPPAAN